MTTITGDNITYTSSQLFNATGGIIERTSLTADSTDVLCTAADIITYFKGTSSLDPTGNYLELFILNDSNFTITLTVGTGITMKPGPTDKIYPNTLKRYTIVVRSSTLVDIFNLDYNGTPLVSEMVITNKIESLSGNLNIYGNIFNYRNVTSITAPIGVTYTTGQIFGSLIKREISSSLTDQLPTATDIITSIEDAKIGTSFNCYIQNITDDNDILTISPNTGITISGEQLSIKKQTTLVLMFVITNVISPAAVCYIIGSLIDSIGGEVSLIRNISESTYTLIEFDDTISVNTNPDSICTLTLPEISTIGQKRYHISDSGGKSRNYNIVIVPSGTDTILSKSSFTINSNFGSISMYNDTISNWVLY